MKKPAPEAASMLVGIGSAIGASSCCVLPLMFVSLGIGGAWLAQLRALEKFFPVFVGIAIASFGYGFYRVYGRRAACKPDGACDAYTAGRQRAVFWTALLFAVGLIVFPFVYA